MSATSLMSGSPSPRPSPLRGEGASAMRGAGALPGAANSRNMRGRSQANPTRNPVPRNTKIVATLGPACSDPAVLHKMLAAGVDVVRLNFSHGLASDHVERARLVRECARNLGRRSRDHGRPAGPEDPRRQVRRRQGHAEAGADVHPRRGVRAGRRDARRPRLQGAAARRHARRGAAAQRRPDPARRRARSTARGSSRAS